jgi:cell division protease FtsH
MALSPVAALAFAGSMAAAAAAAPATTQPLPPTPLQRLSSSAALPPGAADAARAWLSAADEAFTFMDWVPSWAGLDLQRLGWDPDLALRFKRAVSIGRPRTFINGVLERVDVAGRVPDAGTAGDMRISYARFLDLLASRRVKRVIVYGDLRTAVVEVPHPWTASMDGSAGQYPTYEQSGRAFAGGGEARGPMDLRVPDPLAPDDPSRAYAPEAAEWDMDKYRFYVDLPGDFWRPDSSPLLRHLREQSAAQQVVWDAAERRFLLPWEALTRVGEVGRTELQVMRPADSWAFAAWLTTPGKLAFYEKAAAVCLFVRAVCVGVNVLSATGLARYLGRRAGKLGGKRKKDKRQSQWERLTRAP